MVFDQNISNPYITINISLHNVWTVAKIAELKNTILW
jgi:hypothetical protein